MKVVIRDLDNFHHVFGADCFIKNFPELQTTGVVIKRLFNDCDYYYVIDPATGWYYDISAFFTKAELPYLKEIRKVKQNGSGD